MLISILYDSGHGRTAVQANAVAEGIRQVAGAKAALIALADAPAPWDHLKESDAIIFSSPTYNGSVSARFKRFMEDATGPVWRGLEWRDKRPPWRAKTPQRRWWWAT